MAVPDYETMMLPIIRYLGDHAVRKTSELVSYVQSHFDLSTDEMKELIPSGRAKLVNNRVGWASTYLRKAGLITSPQRAYNQITESGIAALEQNPDRIDTRFLQQFEDFQRFVEENRAGARAVSDVHAADDADGKTPSEIIGLQSQILNASLAADLLDQVSEMPPDRFEELVVDLLLAMGYGGSEEDAGKAIGQSNDGGIDGVIKEDPLGLETLYIQAKRWKNTVPVREVRDFAGALMSKRSNRGVFITTSTFPGSAYEFVASIDKKIVLIDGTRLADLMIRYDLGVSTSDTIKIKELDQDYFTA